ncbi:metallophosphoesterase [Rubellicoccus peritrichatus]|uniref:Metallophosphoesterase n=1 Tax=Rubellicoccus peritrichatus TaxID=3080537 RepID=A0AAQ3LF10_9BACT|nr:metallophosphoesterase [Puniceicoccus sp. CR14]WOO43359.1 metallophosphoesterase [Puniceicoccus sp. CR14]
MHPFKNLSITAIVICSIASFAIADSTKGFRQPLFTWTDTPSSTINMIWLTDANESDSLQWRAEGEDSWKNAIAGIHPFGPDKGTEVCQLALSGLESDTIYEVKLGGEIYRFRTLPDERPVRLNFAAGGDMMHTPEMHRAATKAMAKSDPAFAILGGDLAYANGRDQERWFDWINVWVDEAVTSDGLSIPFIVAIGNHEVIGGYNKTPAEAPYFYSLFPFPEPNKSNYVVDVFDDMSVFVLDTNHTQRVIDQEEWLEQTLKERANHKHLFAVYHFPAYGIKKKGLKNENSKQIREHWTPLFDQYNLDAAFENDSHIYKRSVLIRDDKKDPEGTLYIGDGAWGVTVRDLSEAEVNQWHVSKAESRHHFIDVLIDEDVRTYTAYDPKGIAFDQFVDDRDAAH